jgi:hypothetical protein
MSLPPEVLAQALRPLSDPIAYEDPRIWWRDFVPIAKAHTTPIDAAIVNATKVDRLGFAFAGGYAAALSRLLPGVPVESRIALAATENRSAHPRSIMTALDREAGTVTGKKTFVTLAPAADRVLVIARDVKASEGRDRPCLKAVLVDAHAPNLSMRPIPETPIVPEIPHAIVELDRVPVRSEDVLEGDGYERYLKPFRTAEDIHVQAGLLSFLLAIGARAKWPNALREEMLAALCALRGLALSELSSPVLHVALGGAIRRASALVASSDALWDTVDRGVRDRWVRDRGLLLVADRARTERLEKAWARVSE